MMQEIHNTANGFLLEFPNTYVKINKDGEFSVRHDVRSNIGDYSQLIDILPMDISESNNFGKWIISQINLEAFIDNKFFIGLDSLGKILY